MQTYSTKQAAQMAGIHPVTLIRWVEANKIRPSQRIKLSDAQTHWRWTDRDVEKVRRMAGKSKKA
jgi:predicted site-specific integrase-resolvase